MKQPTKDSRLLNKLFIINILCYTGERVSENEDGTQWLL